MITAAPRVQLLRLPLIALLLAGCTAASSSSQQASEPASVAPSEPAGSQAAEPSSATCDPGTICATPVFAPGDYTSTSTGARITFTLAEGGWAADADTPGVGFALYPPDSAGPAGITVAPWAGTIFTDPCAPDPTETIGTTPADLMGVLTAFDGVEADTPTALTVGGLPALQVNLTVAGPCPGAGEKLWAFQTSAGATFNLRDKTRARIYVVDAGSFSIVIAIEAIGEADYEALLQRAEEVIGTMVISPAS